MSSIEQGRRAERAATAGFAVGGGPEVRRSLPRRPLAVLPAALLVLVAGCEAATGPRDGGSPRTIDELPRSLTGAEQEVVGSSNAFGFRLLHALEGGGDGDGDGNVFISPLSASVALGMTANGAAGSTLDGMLEALALEGTTLDEANRSYRDLLELLRGLDPAVDLRVANSVWLRNDHPVRPEFTTRVEEFFDAEADTLDFAGAPEASAERVNEWVAESTAGKIEKLVEPETVRDLVAFMANVVHFEGEWRSRFDPDETGPGDFRRPDGRTVEVPMMRQEGMEARFGGDEDVRVADLPYGGGAFSMTVVVPRGERALGPVAAGLDRERWRRWIEALEEGTWTVVLPRFELRYEKRLGDALASMGMDEPFDPKRADFSRLSERALEDELHVSRVEQKTFVSVDEEGTEASAATGVGVGTTSAPRTFTVNRPFLVAIRERLSGTILFLGTVVDPSEG